MNRELDRKVDFAKRMTYVDGEIDADILYFKSHVSLFKFDLLVEHDHNVFNFADLKKELRQNEEILKKRDLK